MNPMVRASLPEKAVCNHPALLPVLPGVLQPIADSLTELIQRHQPCDSRPSRYFVSGGSFEGEPSIVGGSFDLTEVGASIGEYGSSRALVRFRLSIDEIRELLEKFSYSALRTSSTAPSFCTYRSLRLPLPPFNDERSHSRTSSTDSSDGSV